MSGKGFKILGSILIIASVVVCGWLFSLSFIFMAVFSLHSVQEALGLLLGAALFYVFSIPFVVVGIILLRRARRQNALSSPGGMACLIGALCLVLTWLPLVALGLFGLYTDGWARAGALNRGLLVFSTSVTLVGIVLGISAFYFFRRARLFKGEPVTM